MANSAPETFGDFVRRVRRDKGLSLTDVSARSARFGQRIAASYVGRIENDPTRRVTADRLKALAYGLGVPVQELLTRSVGLVHSDERSGDELHLIMRFRELSPERKADVLKIVDLW